MLIAMMLRAPKVASDWTAASAVNALRAKPIEAQRAVFGHVCDVRMRRRRNDGVAQLANRPDSGRHHPFRSWD